MSLQKQIDNISITRVQEFFCTLIDCLAEQGAEIADIKYISLGLIINAIINECRPNDVAWAILQ